jgi:hypothetical protein
LDFPDIGLRVRIVAAEAADLQKPGPATIQTVIVAGPGFPVITSNLQTGRERRES